MTLGMGLVAQYFLGVRVEPRGLHLNYIVELLRLMTLHLHICVRYHYFRNNQILVSNFGSWRNRCYLVLFPPTVVLIIHVAGASHYTYYTLIVHYLLGQSGSR